MACRAACGPRRARPLRWSPTLLDGIAFDVINDDLGVRRRLQLVAGAIVGTGLTGWLAEGRPGNYWFDVLVN